MNSAIWQPLCDKSVNTDYDILYCRLSKDDRDGDESDSISHQKEILADFAAKNGFDHPIFVVDDGFTGTNFQRPGWQLVLQEIENGAVRSIICKNKDRFGRDYLRVGLYMELFKERSIRFIAIGDGFDNIKDDDDFGPFRDIISELYAKDTSKKIKAVLHSKGHSGKPLTNQAIYGYRKDPADRNRWLVDDTAAPIVRRIFQMTIDGKGPYQIARTLNDEQIIRPSCHIAHLNDCVTAKTEQNPYGWTDATITNILHKPKYMGYSDLWIIPTLYEELQQIPEYKAFTA